MELDTAREVKSTIKKPGLQLFQTPRQRVKCRNRHHIKLYS